MHITALHCNAQHCTALYCLPWATAGASALLPRYRTALHCQHCTVLPWAAAGARGTAGGAGSQIHEWPTGISLHYTSLHCTAQHHTALHCTALNCPALPALGRNQGIGPPSQVTAFHYTALHTALHCTALPAPGPWPDHVAMRE